VRRSVLELAQARASGAPARPATDRLAASIRHLQQQAEAAGGAMLPDLRCNGCLLDGP
jgi:hypothetical protein